MEHTFYLRTFNTRKDASTSLPRAYMFRAYMPPDTDETASTDLPPVCLSPHTGRPHQHEGPIPRAISRGRAYLITSSASNGSGGMERTTLASRPVSRGSGSENRKSIPWRSRCSSTAARRTGSLVRANMARKLVACLICACSGSGCSSAVHSREAKVEVSKAGEIAICDGGRGPERPGGGATPKSA